MGSLPGDQGTAARGWQNLRHRCMTRDPLKPESYAAGERKCHYRRPQDHHPASPTLPSPTFPRTLVLPLLYQFKPLLLLPHHLCPSHHPSYGTKPGQSTVPAAPPLPPGPLLWLNTPRIAPLCERPASTCPTSSSSRQEHLPHKAGLKPLPSHPCGREKGLCPPFVFTIHFVKGLQRLAGETSPCPSSSARALE